MRRAQGLPLVVFQASLVVAAFFGRTVEAANPEWVEGDTWLKTYLGSMEAICRLEREENRQIPPFRNERQLPAVVFSETYNRFEPVDFEVDITGVQTLYLGTSSRVDIQEAVLVDTAGVEHRLVGPEDLTPTYTRTDDRGRCEFFGDYRRQQRVCRLHEAEVVLELAGQYATLKGKLASHELSSVTWIDTLSHAESWRQVSRHRRDVWHRVERQLREKYEQGLGANDARRLAGEMKAFLPSFHQLIEPRKAAAIFAEALCARHAERTDQSIVDAVSRTAKSVDSFDDFERLVNLGHAVLNFGHFRYVRDMAGGAQECPGLAVAFEKIEKDYLLLDPTKVDYGYAMRKRLDMFKDLIDECKEAAQHVQIAKDTIAFVDQARPVSDDVRHRLKDLEEDLGESADDLTTFLAVRDEIRQLRREVLFSHPSLDFQKILINRSPPTRYSHNGDQHLGRHSRTGPGLTILTDWKSKTPTATAILEDRLPPGSVRNPDLHYDAEKVVFAYCDHTTAAPDNQRRFFLYEAAIDGSWVRQLTGTHRDPLKTWNDRATALVEDNDPCYLPDGGIVFISTRGQSYGRCHGGRYNPAWVLHRCDADGNHIQQLSYGNENEYEPSVLNDGRIVFTRWEYTNRHEMLFHMLWWCRPDGSAVSHFYGNDTLDPMMVVEASAMPGTHRVVATAQGHHSYNTGTTVVLDINKGENGEEPVTHITPETPYSESHGWPSPHFSHPYAITEDLFLVSRANHRVQPQGSTPPVADRAIYLVDTLGGRELIYEDPDVASFSPIVIRKRTRPPVLAPIVPKLAYAASKHQRQVPEYGTVFVQNVYLTQNDPEGKIKPGSIKAIRVNALGVQPRARRSECSQTVGVEIPKKVLGTVPVNEDGSAYFKVPARTSLQLQILDESGRAMLTEKSLFYLQPGESRSCVGCHALPESSPIARPTSQAARMLPLDLTPPAGPQYAGGLSFMRTVQPVLDRYCIKCHGLEKMEKDVDLVMDDARYPKSYMALIQRGDHRLGQKGYKSAESYLSRPYEFYAYSNKVPQMLLEGHGKLNVDRESRLRIIEWLDLNAQCYGDLFPNKLEHRRLDTKALDVLRGHIKEHFGEELAAQPDRALINVAQIDESRILMAPLSAEAGGWGQIDGWTSKDDPAYQEMVKLVEACVVKSDRENRGGWEPTLETGAGEDWVVKAREAYLGQFDEDVPTEQPTP